MWTRLYALDIETDTSPVTDSERAAGFTSRGLDPRITPVVNVAVSVGDEITVLRGAEKELLEDLDALLGNLEPGVLVTWNGAVFDLPFLQDRAQICGAPLGLHLSPDPLIVPKYSALPGHQGGYQASWKSNSTVAHAHLDIAYAYRQACSEAGVEWGLKPTARAVGLNPVEVQRTAVHDLSPQEQDEYVASDVRVTLALTTRLLTTGPQLTA
jgi:hypothetical protein